MLSHIAKARSAPGKAYIYAPGVLDRAGGAVACRMSATVVSGGAVADKLPRKPQKLSGPGVGGRAKYWRTTRPEKGGGFT